MTDTKEHVQTADAQMADGSNAGKEVARPVGRMTIQQEREFAQTNMLADVEAHKGDLTKFLGTFGIEYDFFLGGLRIFLMRQMQTQPEFFSSVTPQSFMEALFRCAKDGLIPDGKEAAIGHFKAVATYMPMRDGLVKVLWRTGMIKDINDNVVTKPEDDQGRFEYQEGDGGFIRHRPMLDRKDTDETMAAYCVINLMTGGTIREVVMKADLEKIAKMSKSPARREWRFQMDRKAAIRRVMGKMPRESGIAQVLAHDDMNYDSALISAAPREAAIPTAKLFSNRAHVRKRPEAATDTTIDTPTTDDVPADDISNGVHTEEPLIGAVTKMLHAADLASLAEAEIEAKGLAVSPDEIAWVEETRAKRFAELAPPADDEQPFVLQAVISSATGLKEYEDAALWSADLLAKMSASVGDALKKFWAVNRGFVFDAGENGHQEEAERVLAAAEAKGLPTEPPQ